MFDWQAIGVLLIIIAALIYALLRVRLRLGSFCPAEDVESPSCAACCARCSANKKGALTSVREVMKNHR